MDHSVRDEEGPSMCSGDLNTSVESHLDSGDSTELANDTVQVYAEEVLTLSLIYNEFSKGIREGDSERVIRCWKYLYLMLIFKAAQRIYYLCKFFWFTCSIEIYFIASFVTINSRHGLDS